MSRELMILRHAKSSWKNPVLSDYDRPLNGRGKRDAPKMGRYMLERGLVPDLILSSPAKRARQTATRARRALDLPKDLVDWREELYLAEPETWLSVLAHTSSAYSRVLIVGHNPGLEELAAHLLGDDTPRFEDGKLLPTATLARMSMPSSWKRLPEGCASLISITRPRSL